MESTKCPICGQGILLDITYREGSPEEAAEDIQTSDTRQVETYSCGHESIGPRLDRSASGSDALEVERRETDETVDPTTQAPTVRGGLSLGLVDAGFTVLVASKRATSSSDWTAVYITGH